MADTDLLTVAESLDLERSLRDAIHASIRSMQAAATAYHAAMKQPPLFLYESSAPAILPAALMENATLLPDRYAILDRLPKGGRGLEVGTQTGGFAKEILARVEPDRLDIIDIDYSFFDRRWFEPHVADGRVVIHEGMSADIISGMPDGAFDWIYVDAAHDYASVAKDIEASWRKVAPDGHLIFNDFTAWSPLEMVPYGVMQAVYEFLARQAGRFVISALAFHPLGYHDIVLRRRD